MQPLTLAAAITELTVSTTLLGASPYQLSQMNIPPSADSSKLLPLLPLPPPLPFVLPLLLYASTHCLGPTSQAPARPAAPAVMCTTALPAQSMKPFAPSTGPP